MKCLKCFTDGYSQDGQAVKTASHYASPERFDDADGAHHVHSESTKETTYECERGHSWTLTAHRHCFAPNCAWNKAHRDATQWHHAKVPA